MFTATETVTLLYSMYFAVQDVHRYRNRHTVIFNVFRCARRPPLQKPSHCYIQCISLCKTSTATETVTLLYSMYFAVQDVHRYRNRHTVIFNVFRCARRPPLQKPSHCYIQCISLCKTSTATETVTLLYSMYFAVQDVHRYRNRHTVIFNVFRCARRPPLQKPSHCYIQCISLCKTSTATETVTVCSAVQDVYIQCISLCKTSTATETVTLCYIQCVLLCRMFTAAEISEIRNITFSDVLRQTTNLSPRDLQNVFFCTGRSSVQVGHLCRQVTNTNRSSVRACRSSQLGHSRTNR